MVTAKILLADGSRRINTCGNTMHLSGISMCRGYGLLENAMQAQGLVDGISGAAFAMRQDVYNKIGGFDDIFFMYMEDTDISRRVRMLGLQCWYTPLSLVYHNYTLRFTPRKVFYQERNRYLMLFKTMRWGTLLALLPTLLLTEVITWGFVLLKDRSRIHNKIEAYAWMIRHWSEIRARRRQVQSLRQISDRHLLRSASIRLDFEQVDQGLVGLRLAQLVFTPLFGVLKILTLAVVWW
jgi:GT2 family glycosyltransferase